MNNKENPIKQIHCDPDIFIAHPHSGAPPEILGGVKASDIMHKQLNISWQEAHSFQNIMLEAYDEWEKAFLEQSKNTSKLSKQFNLIYGFVKYPF